VKLPRKKRNTNRNLSRGSIEGETTNNELYRLEIVDENMETSQVKVRYVGYSADYDERRARADIVDLSDSDPEDDSMEFTSGESFEIQRFCLLRELAVWIKEALTSNRKGDPVCHIVMSFDKIQL